MTKKICGFCGKAFMVDENSRNEIRRKYCSLDCSSEMDNKREREKRKRQKTGEVLQYDRLCLFCGKKFTTTKGLKVYCNNGCRVKASAERQKVYGPEYREKKRQEKLREKTKKKEKEPLHEANAKARAFAKGMSYGQYYAMIYADEQRHDAKKRR